MSWDTAPTMTVGDDDPDRPAGLAPVTSPQPSGGSAAAPNRRTDDAIAAYRAERQRREDLLRAALQRRSR